MSVHPVIHATMCLLLSAHCTISRAPLSAQLSLCTKHFLFGCLVNLHPLPVLQAYPLDLVRTRLAAQTGQRQYYRGITHCLQTIVADEGLAGLYRGLGATLMQVRGRCLERWWVQ